ncbi:multicopper oxidase domain-containing protein [Fodinisporobacter ferrooxydans]|uniref:Multicopper oxidase domain-containing protein n=1 Tax=Fodinisporobacter ferrooxydans TaxID=2901836 RepID=A0ABY4CNZ8_9BACL|nr:multicopper oxidase domain-containing protein [Alicyclobacillaceae bacterium MYW30-H2]
MFDWMNRNTYQLLAPNIGFARHEVIGGIRRFHLAAEVVEQELVKGVKIRALGYNASTPGPVLVFYEGERVQIVLHNRLSEPTSIHWHGLIVPDNMDGVPGIGAGPIVKPGESFVYDFVVRQSGTYMYHAHANDPLEELMGLVGMIVVLPRERTRDHVDRDYCMLLQEWSVATGSMKQGQDTMKMDQMQMGMNRSGGMGSGSGEIQNINPMSMDFNYFTMNGKSFPDINPILVRYGERIRIRLANLSMNSHPMHLHGHYFQATATDGSLLPAPFFKNTINVAPGETWDIEFVANNPGTWAFHCHKPHHMTNEHQSKMGGMFTIVKYE